MDKKVGAVPPAVLKTRHGSTRHLAVGTRHRGHCGFRIADLRCRM
jgi:hypothetical protein